jgi:flagellar biosynthetic protein FliQ
VRRAGAAGQPGGGPGVAIFQAATSINEQTLTFIPKVVATAAVLLLFGASMLGLIEDFQRDIFAAIAHLGAAPGQ